MTFKYRYKKQILLVSLVVIALTSIIAFSIVIFSSKKENKKSIAKSLVLTPKKEKTEKNVISNIVKVDVKGEVNSPGIYSMISEERVIDAITKAGGLTEYADTSVLNLSKKLTDEMVIIVYSKRDVLDFAKTKEIEKQVQEACTKQNENSITNNACIDNTTSEVSEKINLNTATKEELMTLTGIGETKALDIINYREKNNGFSTIEDLKKVSGIGEATFAKLKESITI